MTIPWNDAADFEEKLERIITQKWIANYPMGVESWSEYRAAHRPAAQGPFGPQERHLRSVHDANRVARPHRHTAVTIHRLLRVEVALLRLAMRIVYADPETARTKAEEAVADPIGVMADNSDNA